MACPGTTFIAYATDCAHVPDEGCSTLEGQQLIEKQVQEFHSKDSRCEANELSEALDRSIYADPDQAASRSASRQELLSTPRSLDLASFEPEIRWTRLNNADFIGDGTPRTYEETKRDRLLMSLQRRGTCLRLVVFLACLAVLWVLLRSPHAAMEDESRSKKTASEPNTKHITKASSHVVLSNSSASSQSATTPSSVASTTAAPNSPASTAIQEAPSERSRRLTLSFMNLKTMNDLGDMWQYLNDNTTMHIDNSRASPLLKWYVGKDFETDLKGGADITRFWGAFPTKPEDIIQTPGEYVCSENACTVVSEMHRPLVGHIKSIARASWDPMKDLLVHIDLTLSSD